MLLRRLCQQTGKIQMFGEYHDGNIFNKHNDQEKKTLVKRIFFTCMEFIQYIHSVHKHRGNSFQRQNYKMRLKQRSLN
jgi:hypothetical protein